jgi:hypothetical protein
MQVFLGSKKIAQIPEFISKKLAFVAGIAWHSKMCRIFYFG